MQELISLGSPTHSKFNMWPFANLCLTPLRKYFRFIWTYFHIFWCRFPNTLFVLHPISYEVVLSKIKTLSACSIELKITFKIIRSLTLSTISKQKFFIETDWTVIPLITGKLIKARKPSIRRVICPFYLTLEVCQRTSLTIPTRPFNFSHHKFCT